MKSVLVDFLIGAGIKVSSIVSYNHLGNNDGKNLQSPATFRSKEISKSNVVDDMVASVSERCRLTLITGDLLIVIHPDMMLLPQNPILYEENEHPDHCVVIKYVPYVGDSKRAMDEYSSEIMMGGTNTVTMSNICEDSLLASPLILDLVIMAELATRMHYRLEGQAMDATATATGMAAAGSDGDELVQKGFSSFHPILTLLHYMLKAPFVPEGVPVVNALFRQKAQIENLLRACRGLKPNTNMRLETMHHPSMATASNATAAAAGGTVLREKIAPPIGMGAGTKTMVETPSVNRGLAVTA